MNNWNEPVREWAACSETDRKVAGPRQIITVLFGGPNWELQELAYKWTLAPEATSPAERQTLLSGLEQALEVTDLPAIYPHLEGSLETMLAQLRAKPRDRYL